MQPGKHPDPVIWQEPSEHTVKNLWIDYDSSHIIDDDGSRIIIGNYIDHDVVIILGGNHIPLVTWSPGMEPGA